MKKVKFGILGCGQIAHRFAAALLRAGDAELTACAARDPERARCFAASHGSIFACSSYEELVRRPDVDAVYIATVHSAHAGNAELCIRAGKAVLCEKPFFTNADDAKRIIHLAQDKHILIMEGMWTRMLPAFIRCKQWIDSGKIGTPTLLRAAFCFSNPYQADSRLWKTETCGGAFFDVGIYPYEFAVGLLGEKPKSILPAVQYAPSGVDATSAFIMLFESGAVAECLSSINGYMEDDAVISGTKGYIRMQHFWRCRKAELFRNNGELLDCFDDPEQEGFIHEIDHFVQMYRAGFMESMLVPLSDTLDFAETADKILGKNKK